MIWRVLLSLLALATLGACVTTQAEPLVQRPYVTAWTHLSAADNAAVTCLLGSRDRMPILGISAHRIRPDGSTLTIYAGDLNQRTYRFWHGYDLKREASGTWRVTFDGECSHTIADLDLSGQLREFEQQRRR